MTPEEVKDEVAAQAERHASSDWTPSPTSPPRKRVPLALVSRAAPEDTARILTDADLLAALDRLGVVPKPRETPPPAERASPPAAVSDSVVSWARTELENASPDGARETITTRMSATTKRALERLMEHRALGTVADALSEAVIIGVSALMKLPARRRHAPAQKKRGRPSKPKPGRPSPG